MYISIREKLQSIGIKVLKCKETTLFPTQANILEDI